MRSEIWILFHQRMALVLFLIWILAEWVKNIAELKAIRKDLKRVEKKSEYFRGEGIVLLIIIFCVAILIGNIVNNVLANYLVHSTGYNIVFSIMYLYVVIRQVIKMIFISEKREFSHSDILGFVFAYLIWCAIVKGINILQHESVLDKMLMGGKNEINVLFLLGFYFLNILFALGGIYIFLYYLWKIGNGLENKFHIFSGKIKKFVDVIYSLWQQGENPPRVRSFLWWNEHKKCTIYKIFPTLIMLLLIDIANIIWMVVKILIKMPVIGVAKYVLEFAIKIGKLIKKLWNKHENNEYMYVLAQISGLCSCFIVYGIIQYDEYGDPIKSVYEFIGTIILIPYFQNKITSIKNNLKEKENIASSEKQIEYEE